MRAIEDAAFARGITAEALMDEAAAGIARTVVRFFPKPGRCIVFAGKGNNAGDAFAAAALLHESGWSVEVRLAFPETELSDLARKKFQECGAATVGALRPLAHSIILDGLLGLGATPPLREPIRSACREINQLRRAQNAYVFAVDLPSGLEGEAGEADADCVTADVTVAVGFAKRGLVADRAINFVGRLEIVPLADLAAPSEFHESVARAEMLRELLPRREYDAFKQQLGRVGVLAGSKGFLGAGLMCSLGALRGGAGLVELFVPASIYEIVAGAAAPEVMVKPIISYRGLPEEKIDAWAIGPGLGQIHASEIVEFIQLAPAPMVVDADALTALSTKVETLEACRGARLLTPHPGEMKRLMEVGEKSRAERATDCIAKYPVTLLLKGSRTIVAERGRPLSYNTTGNPGMATGGMGDVLTGVCAALLGQQLSPYDAARLGAWLCGRAAELAISAGNASEESLLPRDVLDHLGAAFKDLRDAHL